MNQLKICKERCGELREARIIEQVFERRLKVEAVETVKRKAEGIKGSK